MLKRAAACEGTRFGLISDVWHRCCNHQSALSSLACLDADLEAIHVPSAADDVKKGFIR